MKQQTFEEYLQERHSAQYIGTDDSMPDDYEDWISRLDVQEVIDYAEKWGDQLKRLYLIKILAEIIKKNHDVR